MLRKKPLSPLNKLNNMEDFKAITDAPEVQQPCSTLLSLPTDVLKHTLFSMMSPKNALKTATQLSETCKTLNTQLENPLTVTKLLQHVARGEQEQAEAMLKKNPDLLLEKGQVTDYCSRTFCNITAFQYALWALDRHMWQMLLKYFPKDEKEEKGENQIAARQLQELEAKGTKYGKHYDFSPLIVALQTYIDYLNTANFNKKKAKEIWCNVGKAQRQVPTHVANEYCREDQAFYPLPSFKDDKLPRTFSFYNWITHKTTSWYPLTKNNIGWNFAVYRTTSIQLLQAQGRGYQWKSRICWSRRGGTRNPFWQNAHTHDLAAIIALSKVRADELAELKKQLLSPQYTVPRSAYFSL